MELNHGGARLDRIRAVDLNLVVILCGEPQSENSEEK
jgi:hypothetical protein